MIRESNARKFCCEDISKIENYDKAIADTTRMWDCHHKMELVKTGAVVDSTMQDLIDWGIYYNRPADELIFLIHGEHTVLHCKGRKVSEDTRQKLSEAHKGKRLSEEHKRKMSEHHSHYWKGKSMSEEHRRKLSESHKGKSHNIKLRHWKLADGKRVWY